jgi:chorismate dehydratase
VSLLRIAAIDFLNPAPLMWNFEHPPEASRLARHYAIEKMLPAQCAARLGAGEADLGLIPIAAYATLPGLAIVPGCTIASLGAIRSILLVLRGAPPLCGEQTQSDHARPATDPDLLTPAIVHALTAVRSVALDTASRTSATYTRILFRKYWGREPDFLPHRAALDQMLEVADAALLIGDPALYALEDREARLARSGERLTYLDLGQAWHQYTSLPWVSAFWGVRGDAVCPAVTQDLVASRDAGLAHLAALSLEWSTRMGLPLPTVEAYLGHNIHYILDPPCREGIARFYADAEECGLIEQRPELRFM